VGRTYETGAALRSTGSGRGDVDQHAGIDELDRSAEGLHARHGALLKAGSERAGVPAEATAAVVLTETSQLRGVADDRVPVRFEPYEFFRETGRWLVATHRDQDAEYHVLDEARAIDPAAAHRALRVGVAQVSGREAAAAGFETAEAMLAGMQSDEQAQIDGFLAVVSAQGELRDAMSSSDWSAVAELRAGPGFGALGYDDALAAHADAYRRAAEKGYGGGDDGDDDKPKKPRKSRSKGKSGKSGK